jgi:hypothetical protein
MVQARTMKDIPNHIKYLEMSIVHLLDYVTQHRCRASFYMQDEELGKYQIQENDVQEI